jgi:hypothetical protein
MATNDREPSATVRPPQKRVRDLPGCLKYILLAFLLLLLLAEIGAGEFRKLGEGNWIIWGILLLKLILIIGLLILIKVQKDLKCELTAPTGCTEEEPDPVAGMLFVRVLGTASGAVFGHYTLEIQKNGDPPIPGVVVYPPGGGTVPVVAGELGRINTTLLSDSAYTITLRVFPAGPGAAKVCTTSFNLLKVIVYINRVAQVLALTDSPVPNNPNPLDEDAELRSGSDVKSVGGSMTIAGSAYIYECAGRKIKSYEIRYTAPLPPAGEPPQPPKDAAVPADWPVAQRVSPLPLEYTLADQYAPWTRVGPASTNLINSWKTMTIGATTFYKLNPTTWNSGAAGNGRISLLLFAEDTAGHRYFDIQHAWIDNRGILGQIVKFQRLVNGVWTDLPPCVDILLSFGKLRIMGLAWDPLIDDAWPVTAPNDNFGHYRLDFWKQFGPAFPLLGNTPTRVPALPAGPPFPVPTAADADELAQWNLSALDAGAIPNPYVAPPQPKIYRGEACSYDLQLFVTDTSVVNEGTTHYTYHQVPLKIINDL